MTARVDVPSNESAKLVPTAQAAYERALENLERLQHDSGALAGEVVWNPMLVCQYVIVRYIVGRPIPEDRKRRIRRGLEAQVRPDGGWGMHPDSESWLFHTTLGYVALRLLGHPPDDPLVAKAGKWIADHGGVYAVPQWGRIWLALLGLFPWSGVYPILPEMWLLPDRAPAHPRRLYCHMRLIYLGLSYLYGMRFCAPVADTLRALRGELYPDGYDPARFDRHQDDIAATDLYEEPGTGLRLAFAALRKLERFSPGRLRRLGLERCFDHILFEFRSTDYVCLSPVNGQLFCLAMFATDPDHPELDRALEGIEYWMWEDEEEGLRICGARSDIWDTSFVLQALSEGPRSERSQGLVDRASRWLEAAQITREIPDGRRHYRSPALGGWGFADEKHPWPVSDCTAEALEALMRVEEEGGPTTLSLERKRWAIEFVLRRQNDDGGFGSYESRRGSMALKWFNPAEIYGNCMLEYSYTECTASCVRGLAFALADLRRELPSALRAAVEASIERGRRFLLEAQHENGGWAGFWGINFTYGTYFAVHGLLAAGTPPADPVITRAIRWLLEHQRADGGWGESWKGLLDGSDVPLPDEEASVSAQTAWALLTLMAVFPDERDDEITDSIRRGITFLIDIQQDDGGWPYDRATGVFFNTAVLDYRLYKHAFSTWALARFVGREPAKD